MTVHLPQSSSNLVIRSDGPFYQIHDAGPLVQSASSSRYPTEHLGHGIPGAMAAGLAFMTDKTRMSFVRANRKDTGMTAKIEGAVAENDYANACHWGTRDEYMPQNASLVTLEEGPLSPRGTCEISGLQVETPTRPSKGKLADDGLSFDDAVLTHHGDFVTTMGEPVNKFYDTIPGISRVDTVTRIARRFGFEQEGFDAVVAPAFGGIPLAVATAAVFDLPCLIVNLKSEKLNKPLDPASFIPKNCLVVDDFISVGSRFLMLEELLKRIGVADATYAAVAGFADSPRIGNHRLRLAFTLPEREFVTEPVQSIKQ